MCLAWTVLWHSTEFTGYIEHRSATATEVVSISSCDILQLLLTDAE